MYSCKGCNVTNDISSKPRVSERELLDWPFGRGESLEAGPLAAAAGRSKTITGEITQLLQLRRPGGVGGRGGRVGLGTKTNRI